LAYIDVDDFKKVNDTLGHAGGDAVLRSVGGYLAGAVRHEDVAARLGGDEFAVLLVETDDAGTRSFLERARAAVAKHLLREARPVTLSIGAVVFSVPPASVDELLSQADALMYRAKAAGKNRFEVEVVGELA
jgi:diguanylate cyclase (GGDEF)-like protein